MTWRLPSALVLGLAMAALAADVPLDGTKVGIRERPGRTPRSDFTSRDMGVVLPAPGSPGDPSLGGATIEIRVDAGGTATLVVPGGAGWKVTATPRTYLYKNGAAPAGGSSVRKLLLRDGKLVKLAARGTAVGAASPAGGVSVGLTLANGDVLCARFPSGTIVKDAPGTLVARNAPAPAFCTPPTTSTSTSTTTTPTTSSTSTSLYAPCVGGTAPSCGGTCDVGESCRSVFGIGGYACICVPDGIASCGHDLYPTCGGACGGGNVCLPGRSADAIPFTGCACTSPDALCGGGPGPGDPNGVCTFGGCGGGQVCVTFDTTPGPVCMCGPS
jgi:hypothetical protein